jgi:hypothetical protein
MESLEPRSQMELVRRTLKDAEALNLVEGRRESARRARFHLATAPMLSTCPATSVAENNLQELF